MKTNQVIIEVIGGVVCVRQLPAGIRLEVRDYDVDDRPLVDEHGESYARDEYEGAFIGGDLPSVLHANS